MTTKDFIIFLGVVIIPLGISIGLAASVLKDYLDDNILHKDFDVEKCIEENSTKLPLGEDGYVIKLNFDKLKTWQLKRIVDYVEKTGFSFIRDNTTHKSPL